MHSIFVTRARLNIIFKQSPDRMSGQKQSASDMSDIHKIIFLLISLILLLITSHPLKYKSETHISNFHTFFTYNNLIES